MSPAVSAPHTVHIANALATSPLCLAPVAEIAARQVGDIQCNVDRLSIVGDLAGLQKTLKTLSGQTTK